MKLLRLPLVLLGVCSAQQPSDAPPPVPAGQTATAAPGDNIFHAFAQGKGNPPTAGPDLNMPKTQRDAIIKADHRKNLDDAVALLKLAEELKSDLEKEDPLIVSIKNIKQTEDIQKIAKRIQGRLKHN